jgi:hypothetical protein
MGRLAPVTHQELARALAKIQPKGRDVLRRAMRAEHCERDELAARLQRGRSPVARDLADLIDTASLRPEFRQQLVRVLGQLEAVGSPGR